MSIWKQGKGKPSASDTHAIILYILNPTNQVYVQLIRYLFAGGSAALVDWLFYWLLISIFEIQYIIAAFISFTLATTVNYYLSVKWVFNETRFNHITLVSLVFIVSGIGLLINQLSLFLFVEMFSIHFMLAKVLATGIVFFWNFAIRKYYIFSH